MEINNMTTGGGGGIAPFIPESNLTWETYTENGTTYAFLTGMNLSGLSGNFSVPEKVGGYVIRKIQMPGRNNYGGCTSLTFPYPFYAYANNGSVLDTSFFNNLQGILTININTILGIDAGFFPGDSKFIFGYMQNLRTLNVYGTIIPYVGDGRVNFFVSEKLMSFNPKKWGSSESFGGSFPNLRINDSNAFSNFSIINFKKVQKFNVSVLNLTNLGVINSDETFKNANFSELHLDIYYGDNNHSGRFANNANLTTIYAPVMDTVSKTDFENCPNIQHIYTNADNVDILKAELTNKGYTSLVDKVSAL